MLHTVYKTTNVTNGRYYVGVHKTGDPNDDYLGSGLLIRRAIAKYGTVNFKKEVLFIYVDAESAFRKEFELIQTFSNDPLCMNLRQGGAGGFDWINRNALNRYKSEQARQSMSVSAKERAQRPEGRRQLEANGKVALLQGTFVPGRPSNSAIEKIRQKAFGRQASDETKQKMSARHKERSSEFNSWCVRKRWAVVKGLPFDEPRPQVYLEPSNAI